MSRTTSTKRAIPDLDNGSSSNPMSPRIRGRLLNIAWTTRKRSQMGSRKLSSSGTISSKYARTKAFSDPGDGSSSDVTKKQKVSIEKSMDDEEKITDGFMCSRCYQKVANEEDLLTTLEEVEGTIGVFWIVYNVERDYSQSPDRGSDYSKKFVGKVMCVKCSEVLGGLIIRERRRRTRRRNEATSLRNTHNKEQSGKESEIDVLR